MLPGKQESITADIGAARIRRLEANAGRSSPSPQRPLSDLLAALTGRLQTSLEIDRLLVYFLEEARELLPLSALSYRHSETDTHLRLGVPEGEELSYSLAHQGDSLGELRLATATDLPDAAQDQLESLVRCLLFPLRNALLYRQAVQASLKDPLTGAGNRVALEQGLARETELCRRHGQALSVVMLDMDHFKSLNDTYGHQAGDAALKAVVLLLREQLRNVDMVFRYGGEEFVLVLSNTGAAAASIVAERIRCAVESLCLLVGDKQVRLSASLGCATYQPAETQDNLLRRADHALYEAKRDGRNRTRMAAM